MKRLILKRELKREAERDVEVMKKQTFEAGGHSSRSINFDQKIFEMRCVLSSHLCAAFSFFSFFQRSPPPPNHHRRTNTLAPNDLNADRRSPRHYCSGRWYWRHYRLLFVNRCGFKGREISINKAEAKIQIQTLDFKSGTLTKPKELEQVKGQPD